MRTLLPFLCVPLAGCALLFSASDRELGVIELQPTKRVVIRTVLPRDAKYIRFTSPVPIHGEQRVTVMLTNTSTRTIELRPGAVSAVAPHGSVQLFDGMLSALVSDPGIPVSTWSGRASCELHLQFQSAPYLSAPIRVLCHRSSAPP